ncbi:stalk domain-containing protein [Paenibacillus sp. CAA11]|uniref:stalk domain-containing protein n=1 Tax=Paenibacillus sp. CAA11 TaxID=1532905 RepID=UPI001F2DAE6E|nr:stalk domain-containing protein [Paenibacillus sp. CAA11]
MRVTSAALLASMLTLGAAAVGSPAHAADMQELRLKMGSKEAVMNGEKGNLTRTPYVSGGTLMVPLSAFYKAFGTSSNMGDDNTVRITYGSRAVTLTIGSKVIWTPQGKLESPAAPVMVAGTLMVPLRPVAKGLGAQVSWEGSELVIKLPDQGGSNGESQGPSTKERIGNSYFGWSINNPAGWIQGAGGDDESVATFSDSTGALYLEIHAVKQKVKQDPESLLDALIREAEGQGETVLHEETVTGGDYDYAKIAAEDGDGVLWEERIYYANGHIYAVYLADEKAVHYKDLDKHADLLNSFKPSFDQKDKSTQDLSALKEGTKESYISKYGLTLRIPASWSAVTGQPAYAGPEDQSLRFSVSSVPQGQTLTLWAEQLQQNLKQLFIPEAYRYLGTRELEISGEPGMVIEYETNDGSGWMRHEQGLIIKNGYRYLIDYKAKSGTEAVSSAGDVDISKKNPTAMNTNTGETSGKPAVVSANSAFESFNQIAGSIEIDFDLVKSTYGTLEDNALVADKTKMISKVSYTYGYKLNIPRYWMPVADRFEQPAVEYAFPGGSFRMTAEQSTDPDLTLWQLRSIYAEAAKSDSTFKLKISEDRKIGSVNATEFQIHQVVNGVPLSKRILIFNKEGMIYLLSASLNDANATEEQQAAIDSVLKSFEWTD